MKNGCQNPVELNQFTHFKKSDNQSVLQRPSIFPNVQHIRYIIIQLKSAHITLHKQLSQFTCWKIYS